MRTEVGGKEVTIWAPAGREMFEALAGAVSQTITLRCVAGSRRQVEAICGRAVPTGNRGP